MKDIVVESYYLKLSLKDSRTVNTEATEALYLLTAAVVNSWHGTLLHHESQNRVKMASSPMPCQLICALAV